MKLIYALSEIKLMIPYVKVESTWLLNQILTVNGFYTSVSVVYPTVAFLTNLVNFNFFFFC